MSGGAYLGAKGHHFPAGVFERAQAADAGFGPADVREDVAHSLHARERSPARQGANGSRARARGRLQFRQGAAPLGRARRGGRAGAAGRGGSPLVREFIAPSRRHERLRARRRAAAGGRSAHASRRSLDEPNRSQGEVLRARRPGARRSRRSAASRPRAARSAIGTVRADRITSYQIIAPTTWNFRRAAPPASRDRSSSPWRAWRSARWRGECCSAAHRALFRSLHGLHRALIGCLLFRPGKQAPISRPSPPPWQPLRIQAVYPLVRFLRPR